MITRIVRMEFKPENVEAFLEVFHASKQQIRSFPGVHALELHRDANASNVFYTYSLWDDQAALDNYRFSDFFRELWPRTKALFASPPQAFSLLKEVEVD